MEYPLLIYTLIFLVFFLIGASILTAFNSAILQIGKFQTKELLKKSNFFAINFFLKRPWEKLYFIISVTKHILYLLYAISAFLLLILLFPMIESIHHNPYILLLALSIVIIFLIIDFIVRMIARNKTAFTIKATACLCSIYILIFFFLTSPMLFLLKVFSKKRKKSESFKSCFIARDKVLEMIKDSELNSVLSSYDQTIIASFITFRQKVAREIMIPRVDIFSLDKTTSITEASKLFLSEDYSRIPIFQDNLDNIIGVLMYKDILKLYAKDQIDLLNSPIEKILKPVIYAPENKKISELFQEFRNKHIHLAIIVNEYGGTEGIVTIEDILEELVGEIKDEYDIHEDQQFWQLPSGSWIVDAKMNIIDVEEELGIKIPHNPEYETIGGYIFHRAGSIPTKGWSIHHDEFVIEVLISNERCIEKIRITRRKS